MAQRQKAKSDEWYTPEYAVIPILEYLKPNSTIWCPFDLPHSNYVKVLNEGGIRLSILISLKEKIFLIQIYLIAITS
ncbi:hypothetical protein [Enterococcus sp. SMC-9]|uniref:hypothetical protein n=1 Tax=Enterococcus sp. SMC-9 TaxID=2862343 RepID=UPI001E3BB4CE|nr:hypothetical protein [Enterococcus sp. SMC-9]MCD1025732.1 hypothetical protein [Enterococcus sp. SMC-9]